MVAIVSGNGTGLLNSSSSVLGQQGLLGNAATGSTQEGVYVNVANGNLILQDKDDYLASQGIDLALGRTYNASGSLNDGLGGQWKLGVAKQVAGLNGTLNTTGSYLTRIDGDGTASRFTYDASRSAYVSTDGAGAYQTIIFNSGTNEWVWRADHQDQLGITEFYDAANGGRISRVSDQQGVRLSYQYSGSQLTQIADASGDQTFFLFADGGGVSSLKNVTNDQRVCDGG